MAFSRKSVIWGSSVAGIALVSGALVMLSRPRTEAAPPRPDVPAAAQESSDDDSRTPVKTIHPRRESDYAISVQELATVEPYFRADLMSRVAGTLKAIHKEKGDRVTKGEILAEIDVPDLAQEVNQKEAVVQQRLMDAKLARALVKNAQAAVEFSRNAIKQREAFVKRSQSIVDFRRKRYQRYVELSKRDGVEQEIVAEEDKAYRAAVAEHKSAKLAVKKAEADLREQLALLDRAKANVEVQEAMVGVARKDRDRALALADYAKIYAPFDGVVTDKTMDPGNFVQNATSAHTKPILSLDRIDLVTVVMKLPDNDAPYVKTDTEAIIQMDDLPGTEIRGKVTRFAPAIKNADRNMRVEVDLFNGTEQQYRRYVLQTLGGFLAPLGTTETLDATVLMAASRNTWKLSSKSNLNAFPLMPQVEGRNLGERPLLPGMTGYMRLLLRKFKNLYLVPSSAVYNRGGKSYILVVRDGAAHQLPVRVQANDGAVAKIAVIDHEANPKTGERELDKDLTGREEIIVSRQAELGEGQGVRTTLEKW